jgi:T5SS/PEP-CTERM-associated repeat protein
MATFAGESHAEVGGTNSAWNFGTTMTVGESGYATLDIHSGGRVTSGAAIIGDNADSRGVVDVDGEGSTWEIAGTLDVSNPGEAELRIASGGRVSTAGVTRVDPAGRIEFDGGRLEIAAAAGLTNGGLVEGDGRIHGAVSNVISGEMRTHTGDRLILGATLSNAGVIDLDGGELEVLGIAINTGDITARNAVVRMSSGLSNSAGSQLAAVGGPVAIHGTVVNALNAQIVAGADSTVVFHDTLTNNGQLAILPDSSVLMLKNLSFGGTATLSLQLGAASASAASAPVQVDGTATLAGTLDIDLASGFTPMLGDSFNLLTAIGGRSGFFAAEALPSLPGGLGWDVNYTPSAVTLSVVPNLSADFDSDGDVDAADLARWKGGFGAASGAEKIDGDENLDGDVDGADFLAWQRQVGLGGSTQAAADSVPEPAALWLAAVGLASAAAVRRTCGRRAL